jgi:hypothetical protein
MNRKSCTDRIVVDGPERIMSGRTYQETAHRLRQKTNRRCKSLLSNASLVGKLFIRLRMGLFVRRRLEKLAPPGALYISDAAPVARQTSNPSLQPTASRRLAHFSHD